MSVAKADPTFQILDVDEMQYKNAGLEITARAIINQRTANVFKGTKEYRALVLTNAGPISSENFQEMHGINSKASSATVDSWMEDINAGDPKRAHWVCRCRILEKNSPHQSIPAPENLIDPNFEDATKIVKHPYFVTRYAFEEADMPRIGDIVFVTFERGPAGGSMYKGHILSEKYYSDGAVGTAYGTGSRIAAIGAGYALGGGTHPNSRAADDQTPEKIGNLSIVNRLDAMIGRVRGEWAPTAITLHYTAGGSVASAIAALGNEGLSYHFVIDRDGKIHQLTKTNRKAQHDPATNGTAIGISWVNLGYQEDKAGQYGSLPLDQWTEGNRRKKGGAKTPPFDGKPGKWEPYTSTSISAGVNLVKELKGMYPDIAKVHLHSETSTQKEDPGPAFPASKFR